METVINEIENAIATLGLEPGVMQQLAQVDSESVYHAALNEFVSSGDRRWWWEDFKKLGASISIADGNGWRLIPKITPNPDEPVWFIAEDDQLEHYPVFETSPRIASQILGECYAFEYYLIAKNYSWLVCESHHNVIFAIGDAVESRLTSALA